MNLNPEDKNKKEVLVEGRFKRFIRHLGWEFTERKNCHGVVAITAVTENGELLLVEQFRVPVNRFVIELPAGLAGDIPGEDTETLATAARRELFEETGYEAESMELVAEGPASAASLSDVITLFRARGLKKTGPGGGDETENIRVHEVSLKDLDAWLQQMQREGRYVDAKVYAALYFLEKERQSAGENA